MCWPKAEARESSLWLPCPSPCGHVLWNAPWNIAASSMTFTRWTNWLVSPPGLFLQGEARCFQVKIYISFQINYIVSDSEFHLLNSWKRDCQSTHEVSMSLETISPPWPLVSHRTFYVRKLSSHVTRTKVFKTTINSPPCLTAHVISGRGGAPQPVRGPRMLQHPARAGGGGGVAVQDHRASTREAHRPDGRGRASRQQGSDYLSNECQKVDDRFAWLTSTKKMKRRVFDVMFCWILQWHSCAHVGRLHSGDHFGAKQAGSRIRQVRLFSFYCYY